MEKIRYGFGFPDAEPYRNAMIWLLLWHVLDPVSFDYDLKIAIQDLGWRTGGRFLKQKSDISSVCFWYQAAPHSKYPKLPEWQELEVY